MRRGLMYMGGAECSCDVLERLGMELRLLEGCCACCFWCGQPRHDRSPRVQPPVPATSASAPPASQHPRAVL